MNQFAVFQLSRRLARRYPGVAIEVFSGGGAQAITFRARPEVLISHGLATPELLRGGRDARHRPITDGLGSTLYGGPGDKLGAWAMHCSPGGDDARIPKWAQQAGSRILRRLTKGPANRPANKRRAQS